MPILFQKWSAPRHEAVHNNEGQGEVGQLPAVEQLCVDDDLMLETLRNVFGFTDFKSGQREIIDKIMTKQDGLVLLHTGGGKTLAFTLPAVLSTGLTVIVVCIKCDKKYYNLVMQCFSRAILFLHTRCIGPSYDL